MEFAVQHQDINDSSYLLGRPLLKRRIKHYSNSNKILLVGEGDFSFSLALASAFGSAKNMFPTSLDSREKVLQLYESADQTLSVLHRLGATVLHGVDATTMEKHHIIRMMRFDRIVYNFPHAGFFGKEDNGKVIRQHRHLLKMFFKNARTMLGEIGEIHVTHKDYGPYKKWELVKQAEEFGLILKGSIRFRITDYPGYTNRRGAGHKAGETFSLGKCQTYKFVLGPDVLYKYELVAIPAVLPNVSSEASAESFNEDILEPGSERQSRTPGEITKLNSGTSFNYIKMPANDEIIRSDRFARERNDTPHYNAQTWRVETKVPEQSDEAINMKGDAIKRKRTRRKRAISKFESQIQPRKIPEQSNEAINMKDDAIKRKRARHKRATSKLESQIQASNSAEAENIGLEMTSNQLMAIPDIICKQELMTIQSVLPNVSSEASLENFEVENFEPEFGSHAMVAGKMAKADSRTIFRSSPHILNVGELTVTLPNISTAASAENFKVDILEPESECQERMAGEMEKVDLGTSFKCLKMISYEEINKSGESPREMNDMFHPNRRTWRVKTKSAEQLYEALNSGELAIIKWETIIKEPILELESERQAKNAAEREKYGLKRTLNRIISIPDIHYRRGLMAIQVVSPNVSAEAYAEKIKTDIVESESEMQEKVVGEMAKSDIETFFTKTPYVLYKQELMVIQVILPNISFGTSAKKIKGAILELECERQVRIVGEIGKAYSDISLKYLKMVAHKEINRSDEVAREQEDTLQQISETWMAEKQIAKQLDESISLKEDAIKRKQTRLKEAILEVEGEKQARKAAQTEKAGLETTLNQLTAAQTEKAGLETTLNQLKVILSREVKKSDEFKRKRDEVLCQLAEACREKANIAKQLDEVSRERNDALHQNEETWQENKRIAKQLAEVLRLNENAVKQKDARLLEALSELEFERQARKSAEAEKTYLEMALNQTRVCTHKELEKNHALKRQRDEAICQACRGKTIIANQLDAALRLEEDVVNQRNKIAWQGRKMFYHPTVLSSGLAFVLSLFHKGRARLKGAFNNEQDNSKAKDMV